MKKFRFSLDPVLGYQRQLVDSLRAEYQALLEKVRLQEQVLSAAQLQYGQTNLEYCGKKEVGMMVAEAVSYETGLKVLEKGIHAETQRLAALRRQAREKLEEVVSAKQDTAAIEMLRDKQLDRYQSELQKAEERFIDDLVCARGAGRGSSL